MTILISHPRWRAFGAALLAAALAGCAADKPQPLDAVAPASHSVAEAEARLAKAAADRARAEAAFAADEQQCYNRFMVNNCLDKAREKRRQASSGLRAIEIEAERFLRQAKVDDRDRDLAKAQAEYQAGEARAAAAPPPARTMEPPPPAADPGVARQRAAAQAAKLKNAEAGDQAGAARRAANVQAFEKRKRQSAQRQKEIAEKKKKAVNAAEGEAK